MTAPTAAPVFAYRPLAHADLPRLLRWFAEPHVRAHWPDEPHTLAGVADAYGPLITGDDPARAFVASLDDVPIGYLQVYRIDSDADYARALAVGPDDVSVDMLIGEAAYAHRGLGAPMLRQFVDVVVRALFDAPACWINPAVDNPRAIRAYENAGFAHIKTVVVPGERTPEYLMMCSLATVPPEVSP